MICDWMRVKTRVANVWWCKTLGLILIPLDGKNPPKLETSSELSPSELSSWLSSSLATSSMLSMISVIPMLSRLTCYSASLKNLGVNWFAW
jgi:hypothetical protein